MRSAQEITDPNEIAQLNKQYGIGDGNAQKQAQEITDPNQIAQLNKQYGIGASAQTSGSPFLNKVTNVMNQAANNPLIYAGELPVTGAMQAGKGLYNLGKGALNLLGAPGANYLPKIGDVNQFMGLPTTPFWEGATNLAGAYTGGKFISSGIKTALMAPTLIDKLKSQLEYHQLQNESDLQSSKNDLNQTAQNIQQIYPSAYKQAIDNLTGGTPLPQFITSGRTQAENLANSQYSAKNPYNSYIPSFFQKQSGDITKPVTVNGTKFSPSDLQFLQKNSPSDFNQIMESSGQSGNYDIKSHLGDDNYNILKSYFPSDVNDLEMNPSIGDIHDFSKKANKKGASIPISSPNYQDRSALFQASQGLRNFVKNGLNEVDPNASGIYSQGDNTWATGVTPFDATPRLTNVSTGVDNQMDAPTLLNEINKGQRLSTKVGKGTPRIPSDHFLSNIVPQLNEISSYTATQPLSNMANGTSQMSGDSINSAIQKAIENQKVPQNHVISSGFGNILKDKVNTRDIYQNRADQIQNQLNNFPNPKQTGIKSRIATSVALKALSHSGIGGEIAKKLIGL